MAEFLGRPLGEIDDIYNLVGSQTRTKFIDLSGITLVHDVAPGAIRDINETFTKEVARANNRDASGAVFRYQETNSIAGAGFLRLEIQPWSLVTNSSVDQNEVDLWLHDWAISFTTQAQTYVALAIHRRSGSTGGPTRTFTPLEYSNTPLAPVVGGAVYMASVNRSQNYPQRPYQLYNEPAIGADGVALLANCTGAVGVTLDLWLSLTKKGYPVHP